jgi:phosphatidylglycerophosphate synthase
MFDASLRHIKDIALRSAARALSPLPPMAITLLGFVLGLGAAWCASQGGYIAAFILFWFGRICDGLDGAVARLTNKQSALGGYIDLMCDFIVYAAIPIGIWWSMQLPGAALALITMLAAFYVNAASWMLLSAIVENKQTTTTVAMSTGIIEGFETLLAYSLFLLLPASHVGLFYGFALLVFISALQRVVWAVRHL